MIARGRPIRPNALLYAVTVLIWGSTWFVITLQIGVVPSALAGVALVLLGNLLVIARLRRRKVAAA